MQKRKLGGGALEVSAIGMGYMNLSFGIGNAADINYGVHNIRTAVQRVTTFF